MTSDVAMDRLLEVIQHKLNNSDIHQLNDVWEHYVLLAKCSSTIIPSYISHKSTFKEEAQLLLGDTPIFMPKYRETFAFQLIYNEFTTYFSK